MFDQSLICSTDAHSHIGSASTPHLSVYPWSWLQEHSYDPPTKPKVENTTALGSVGLVLQMRLPLRIGADQQSVRVPSRKVVWGSSIAKDPPTVTYEEAMTDQGLFKWLSKVVSR